MYSQMATDVTTKELSYISDSMKNEDLLTKLCVQGAVECQNQQLSDLLAQLAQERFSNFEQLLKILQQHSQYNH